MALARGRPESTRPKEIGAVGTKWTQGLRADKVLSANLLHQNAGSQVPSTSLGMGLRYIHFKQALTV